MSDQPVRQPGPNPLITAVANPNRVTASVAAIKDCPAFSPDRVDAIAEQVAG